jgi:FkbM family methyltransferase
MPRPRSPEPEAAATAGPAPAIGGREPSRAKALMRAVWLRLPRRATTYKLAKALTRTVLRPERTPLVVDLAFAAGFTMRVDLADIVGNDLFCMSDHYEAPTLALWSALARDAGTILDLGSHVGLYACAAAAANPRARVVAVEAYEPNVRWLRHNARQFANLVPVAAAIATADGRRSFRLSPITGGGYVEADDPAAERSTPGTRGRTPDRFVVETLALSTLCAREGLARVDLVKIDLEGLEEPLLADEQAFWVRWAPQHVVVEIAGRRGRGGAPRRIVEAMERRGYCGRRIERLHALAWLTAEDLANWHFWKVA